VHHFKLGDPTVNHYFGDIMKLKEHHVGLDVSKGTMELCLKNTAGVILYEGTLDDTPYGHSLMLKKLKKYIEKDRPTLVRICMESTGGLERNWYRSLKIFSQEMNGNVEVRILNPLLIHGFVREKLHVSTTDTSAARDIAEYSRLGRPMPKLKDDEKLLDGSVTLYRTTTNAVERLAKLKNEFHSLLPQVHPDLGQYVRDSIPNWVLLFLRKYPTVNSVVRIRAATLAKIPGITEVKANSLLTAAKESIAAYRDIVAGYSMQHIVEEILSLNKNIAQLKKHLIAYVAKDALVQKLVTIPGIAEWSAIGLIVEIGDIRKFPRPEELVAYSGLDPSYQQSGDGFVRSKISRRGKASIRKLLFMAAKTAAIHNPAIKAFYERLRGRGFNYVKAITACMGKLLRITFAVWVSEKEFDPNYEQKKLKGRDKGIKKSVSTPGKKETPDVAWDLNAPISRREAQRRKKVVGENKSSQPNNRTRSMPQLKKAENLSQNIKKAKRTRKIIQKENELTFA
jgi:transposase